NYANSRSSWRTRPVRPPLPLHASSRGKPSIPWPGCRAGSDPSAGPTRWSGPAGRTRLTELAIRPGCGRLRAGSPHPHEELNVEHHNHDREFTEVNGERFDRERIAEGAKLVVEWLEVQAGSLGKAYEISERFNRLGLTSVEAVVALFLAPAIRRAVYDDPEREARDLNVWASEQARLVDWGTLTAARRHRLMLWGMFPGLKIPPGVINSMGGPSPEATEA